MSIKSIMVVIACKATLLGHIKVKYRVNTDQERRHYRGSDLQLDSPLQAAPFTGHTQHEPAPHLRVREQEDARHQAPGGVRGQGQGLHATVPGIMENNYKMEIKYFFFLPCSWKKSDP